MEAILTKKIIFERLLFWAIVVSICSVVYTYYITSIASPYSPIKHLYFPVFLYIFLWIFVPVSIISIIKNYKYFFHRSLCIKDGIIYYDCKTTDPIHIEIPINKITAASYRQSLFDKLFKTYSIYITSSSGNLTEHGVANGDEFISYIKQASS